jgi:hypothetical protein
MTPEQKLALKEILFPDKPMWNPQSGELGWCCFPDENFRLKGFPCVVLGYNTKYGMWHILSSFGLDSNKTIESLVDKVWATKEAADKHGNP